MNVPRLVRQYAQNAQKRHAAALSKLQKIISERPGEFTGDRFTEYHAARALYLIYAESLTLDAVGNSAYNDEQLMDHIRDARANELRALLRNKIDASGIDGVTQHIAENAVRKFLSNTECVDLEDEEQ
ncbi:hypothetical protein OG613_47425 (plasmid) [Streptomyces sp. NBC_00015]|uniref:hypothetical protein n=1 Tax=Streptomyces sp. NBC_00015 TaxID=2903611 RepID=UPI002F90F3E2